MYNDSARIGAESEGACLEPGTAPGLALGPALQHLMAAPLAAVRVMLEELESANATDGERAVRLHATLAQVCALHRDVEALIDLAAPRRVRPLACSVEELARSALALLSTDQEARVLVDAPEIPREVEIDGPLFTDCLARVLAAALSRSGGRVLLQVVCDEGSTVFHVMERRPCGGASAAASSDEPASRTASLALGLQLAERDVKRMGGRFERGFAAAGAMRVTLALAPGGPA
jgi:K+-sensing histidine kinase KdpD